MVLTKNFSILSVFLSVNGTVNKRKKIQINRLKIIFVKLNELMRNQSLMELN